MLSRNRIFLSMVFILVAGFFFLSTPESGYAIENGSDCCSSHVPAGCDDATCSDTVCDMNGFCCDVSWNTQCAEEAKEFCEVCGGTPPPSVSDIPTMSEWGLIALAVVLGIVGIVGFMVIRRRKVSA